MSGQQGVQLVVDVIFQEFERLEGEEGEEYAEQSKQDTEPGEVETEACGAVGRVQVFFVVVMTDLMTLRFSCAMIGIHIV